MFCGAHVLVTLQLISVYTKIRLELEGMLKGETVLVNGVRNLKMKKGCRM